MRLFHNFHEVLIEVAFALLPLFVALIFFQIFLLRLPAKRLFKIIKGLVLTYIGLALFLQGVKAGFLPVGQLFGEKLALIRNNWILIPLGFLLGFLTILAEPAVRVHIIEVEKVTGGHINKTLLLYFMCIGVAVAVALAMVRVLYGIHILYFIAPLYLVAFILVAIVPKDFAAVAFDAGGVATGPMTVTFIMSMTMGAAESLNAGRALFEGFGMVALVAVMPIISILILGFLYKVKGGRNG